MDLINLADSEAHAREKLPKIAYDYYASSAWDEITLHENHRAYDRIQLQPRMLIDVSQRDLATVIRAIALGAKAVLIGRPVVWGLAVDGEQGVTRVLNLLRAEVDLAMALCGCRSIADITRELIG